MRYLRMLSNSVIAAGLRVILPSWYTRSMPPVDIDAPVIANARLSRDYSVLSLAAPEVGRRTQPGQQEGALEHRRAPCGCPAGSGVRGVQAGRHFTCQEIDSAADYIPAPVGHARTPRRGPFES